MKQVFKSITFSYLLFFSCASIFAQNSIGIDAGLNLSGNIPLKSLHVIGDYEIGGRAGLFFEHGLGKHATFRTGLYYDIRVFNVVYKNKPSLGFFNAMHFATCPFLFFYKTGVFQVGLGPELMALIYTNIQRSNNPTFHLGLRGEIALQVSKKVRLQVAIAYDFVKAKHVDLSTSNFDFNTISFGVSLAYTFKKFKKKRFIYSP